MLQAWVRGRLLLVEVYLIYKRLQQVGHGQNLLVYGTWLLSLSVAVEAADLVLVRMGLALWGVGLVVVFVLLLFLVVVVVRVAPPLLVFTLRQLEVRVVKKELKAPFLLVAPVVLAPVGI